MRNPSYFPLSTCSMSHGPNCGLQTALLEEGKKMMSSYAVSCLLKALKAYFYIHNIFILHDESSFLHNTTFLCTVGCNTKLHNMYHHICVSKPSQLPEVNFIVVHHHFRISSAGSQKYRLFHCFPYFTHAKWRLCFVCLLYNDPPPPYASFSGLWKRVLVLRLSLYFITMTRILSSYPCIAAMISAPEGVPLLGSIQEFGVSPVFYTHTKASQTRHPGRRSLGRFIRFSAFRKQANRK